MVYKTLKDSKAINKNQKPTTLARSSMILIIGDFLTKGSKFLLLPFYVKFLTKEQVGVISLLQSAILFFGFFLGFELSTAVKRFYFDYKEEKQGEEFIAFVWWSKLFISILVSALLIILFYWFNPFPSDIPVYYLQLTIVIGCLQSTFDIPLAKFLINKQPLKVRTFSFLQFFISLMFTIYLIAFAKLGVEGFLYSQIIANLIFTIASAVIVSRKFTWPQYTAKAKELFKFSAPLIPHRIFNWGLALSDRFILAKYVDLIQLGIYGVGFQLGTIISLVAKSIQDAWLPDFFSQSESENHKQQYATIFKFYTLLITLLSIATIIFSREIIELFFNKSYLGSVSILNIIVFAYAINAMYLGVMGPIYYVKKTKFIFLLSSTSFALNVILNLIFIPGYGIIAAAYTSLFCNLIRFILAYIMSQKLYHIPFDLKRIISIIIVLSAVLVVGFIIKDIEASLLVGVIKALFLIAVSALFIFSRVTLKKEEQKLFFGMIKRIKSRKKA